ncbi:Protein of unknown function [Gryllus bimaculatus]|nr:Protein of unknown function [Gryllus bimaculatus]
MRRLCLYPFCPSCSACEALNQRWATPLGRRTVRTRCARRPYRPTYFQEHRFTPKRNSASCSGERYSDTSYEVLKQHTTNGLLLGLYTEEVLQQKVLGAGPSGACGGWAASPAPLVGLRRRNAMRRIKPNPCIGSDNGAGGEAFGPKNEHEQPDDRQLRNHLNYAESVLVQPFEILSESLGSLREKCEGIEELRLKADKESCTDFATKYSK